VNALANEEVGKYLNTYCVATFQKVATFTIAGNQKQGGNVAAYFCTADGQVLHAIAGPVNAAEFLREARWVVETRKLALLEGRENSLPFQAFVRKAHADRLRLEHNISVTVSKQAGRGASPALLTALLNQYAGRALGRPAQVHVLLASYPRMRLQDVYPVVFESILNEKISTSPVVVAR
jgi:hypothetical protein